MCVCVTALLGIDSKLFALGSTESNSGFDEVTNTYVYEILLEPRESQGYLAWRTDDPSVREWLVVIEEEVELSGQYVFQSVEKTHVFGQNYLKIDPKYYDGVDNRFYRISLQAIGAQDGDVVIMPIDDGSGAIKRCYWQCVSGNYAYRIQQYEHQGVNPFSYRLDFAFDDTSPNANTKFFRWFDQSEFGWYTGLLVPNNGNGDSEFHEIPQWPLNTTSGYYSSNGDLSFRMVRLPNNGTYQDINNSVITGSFVYGVQKGRGDYIPYSSAGVQTQKMTLDHCSDPSTPSSVNLTWRPLFANALQQNAGTSNFVQLACTGTFFMEGGIPFGGGGGGGGGTIPTPNICNSEIPGEPGLTLAYSYLCNSGAYGITVVTDENGDATLGQTFANTEYLHINEVDAVDGGIAVYHADSYDFIDSEGYPSVPTINLAPGLHQFNVKFVGVPLHTFYFESNQGEVITVAHKDYLLASAFPNPVTENAFNLHLEASAKLKFDYELRDNQGNLLYETAFQVNEGHDENHRIDPGIALPNGVLINRFIFGDGSTLSVPMLKQ